MRVPIGVVACLLAIACDSAPTTAGEPCGQTIDAYCSNHPCVTKPPPGMTVEDAYCADSRLAKCVTGIGGCRETGGGRAYVEMELDGCDPFALALHDPDSGALLSVFVWVRDAGYSCVAGIRANPVCQGVGIGCRQYEAGPDDGSSSDAGADAPIDVASE